MKDSNEQRIQNQFGAFCVKVLKNEARCIQREYARRREQEKPLDDLTASELEQTATWDKYFMDEHVFEVQGLPVVVADDLLAEAIAQLPEGKRDVILLSYFLGMSDRRRGRPCRRGRSLSELHPGSCHQAAEGRIRERIPVRR